MKQIDFTETYHHHFSERKTKQIRRSLTKINDDRIDKIQLIYFNWKKKDGKL